MNEVVKVLDGLPWQRGFTYIDKALEQAAQGVFTTAAGMRSNVPKVDVCLIFVLLDCCLMLFFMFLSLWQAVGITFQGFNSLFLGVNIRRKRPQS